MQSAAKRPFDLPGLTQYTPCMHAVHSRSFGPLLLSGAAMLTLALSSFGQQTARAPDQIDYNWQVRPILSDNCFRCHGPDANKRQAD